jgi:hypothetical protein
MNRNDRAHPNITVFEMLPQEVKEHYRYWRENTSERLNRPKYKKIAARAAGKRAREARRRNRGGR